MRANRKLGELPIYLVGSRDICEGVIICILHDSG